MTTAVTYKKYGGVATEPESIVTPFKPKIDSFSITDSLTGYYSINLEWTGSFVKTVLYYNTTNNFNLAVDNSLSFVFDTSATVTGLSPATNYYFKIFSFGTGNFSKGTRMVFTQTKRLPVITRINSTAIDTSAISVNWQGIFETVNLVWSETVSFETILGTITDISTNVQDISGLTPNTKYYIKAKPIGLDAYEGSYSPTIISKTLYNPIITSTDIKKLNGTSLVLEWKGFFNNVDIQFDISDTFTDFPTTYSGITKNYYNFTDLSYSTTYYFRVLPYKGTTAGVYGTPASATTLATTPDASVSYIDTYISSVDSSNIMVTWDASYVSMDLHLNSSGIFNDVVDGDVDTDVVVTDLSGTTTYMFMGLVSNAKYYIRTTPYTSAGVASSNQYLIDYTLPSITDISSTNTTSSETIISWDGSFDVVNILYNTTGTFGVSDLSFAGQNESPAEITGLTSNTKYYFRIIPYSNAGTAGLPSSVIYSYTKPAIVSVSCDAIDNSSITVHWYGSGNMVDILWNETGVFGISDNSVNNIDIADQSKRITGLNSTTKYYFKVRPYSSNDGGIYGEYSEFTSEFTLYAPFISSVTGNVIDNSSVVVAWDGSFATVDILWDLSGTFTSLVGSSTDVSLNQYTITGLSASTKYHVKITPKAATYSGTPNTDTSATTLYTPVVSSLTTSQIKPTTITVNWTGTAYSAVDIKWGLTNGFTTNVGSATDISNVLSYTVSGLSPSTVYYFVLTPKETRASGGGFYNGTISSSSASTIYDPSITVITVSTVDNSAVLVGWTGMYSTVSLLYNKTGSFQTLYNLKTGLTGSSNTVTGLDSSTNYYFTVRPYSNTGYVGTDSSMANIATYYTPIINKFMGYVYDSSSILLLWTGLYSTVNIYWDISNVIIQTSGTVLGATGNTTTISGIYNKGDYNFRIVPVSRGIFGTSSAITITKNNYSPVINSVSASSMSITSIMVEWVGNYTSVSLQYNDSGNFASAYTNISGVVSSFYTITGLSSSTTYYFRVLPYYDTTMGPYSSTVSAATSKPPRSYKVPAIDGYMDNSVAYNNRTINGAAVSSSGKYIMVITYIKEGVLLSKDYGITWARMPLPFYANYSGDSPNTNLCISPSGKFLLYAMFVNSNDVNHPVFNTYKMNTMYFYYSTDYGNTWGEFPYKSNYTYSANISSVERDTYFNNRMKLKINDSGECLIGISNYGNICQLFYTADYGTNINILSTIPMGYDTGGVFFGCNETMTNLVCTDSSYNLFSMTAPFYTSSKTLITGGSLTYNTCNYIVMSGDGSTLIVMNKVYAYSNSTSTWSLLRTVTGNIDFYSTQINYNASRIVFKYNNLSIYASYDKFLTYSQYYTPSSFMTSLLISPSKNDSMFVVSGQPSVVTTDNFSTTTPIYTASSFSGANITCSSDYKYIYCIIQQGSIMYSSDYGETFTKINNNSLISIAPSSNYDYNMIKCTADGEILYFATRNRTTDRGTIFKSTNRGITWSLMATNFSYGNFVDCDSTGTLVLTNFSISYNGGVTWSSSPSYPNYNNGPFSLVDHQFLPNTSNTISYVKLDADYGIGKTVYNTTTNTVVNTVFNSINVPGHTSCCSADVKYIYTIPDINNGLANIYKSSNYGNSYTLISSETTNNNYNRFCYKNIKCSEDGATVLYTYSMIYIVPFGSWVGISKDYGVTFNRRVLIGGYNNPNNVSITNFLGLSPNGDNYTFMSQYSLIINSPNINGSISSYISAYVSDISSNTTTINWDPSYSKVDINRNQTNLFDVNDTTLSGITSTTSQIISGLSPNTKYYFRITPYISGVASTKQYTNITTLATATSLTAPTSDTSSVGLVWDGSFTTVAVFYNTTGTFTTSDASLSGITAKTRTVSGLTANTQYYFRLTPVSSSASNGIVSSIVSKYTTPSITANSTSITGLTTINVSITGVYAYYTLKWNTMGVFDVSDNIATNITTSSYSVAGLNIETTYYFKATPVGTSGIVGTTTDVFQETTPYIPKITTVSCYTVNNSTAVVSWDGSFNNVDIYWDLSGTFVTPVGSKTSISGNSNTITGLSGSMKYYFKVLPKYDTFAGTAGTIVNTTTYYNPVLSTLTSTPASTSQINLVWDGFFTGVLIKYNTTNVFDTSGAVFTTLTFTTETAYSLMGLSPATVYYFRAVPQGTTGFNSTTVYNTNSTTDYLPVLAYISAVAIDTSSVTVTIAGLYENANIEYNDSGNYSNSYNTVSTTTANTVINGLIEKTNYCFRVKPVGLRGLSGSYTSTKSVKTLYLPTLSYVFYLTLSKSEISLDYDGSFTSVSIVYDTSSSFAVSPTTITGITTSTYILSGLQNNTKYYLKMLPYVLSVSGGYSTVSTATTNKAASADYEKYMVFDVNFNKSNLVGGVAKENVSGSLSGNFGLGRVTADKRLYVNYTSTYNGGYVLTRNVTTYTNFITCSLWINVFGYYPDLGNNSIIHFEQPWNDINSAKNMDLNLSSTGVISYSEYYGAIGGGRYTYNSNGVVPLNSWTHVALCIDNANSIIYFYVNGVYYPMVVLNTSQYNNAKSSRVNEMVGANITSVIVGMGGNFYIDNVKIYKTTTAIDLAGINALMSDGAVYSSLSSTPVLYYPFDGDYNDYSSGSAVSNATIYSADLYNQASITTNSICGTGSLSLNRIYTQYINLSSFSIDTNGLTVCGWVNTAQTDNNSSLFQLGNGSRMIYLCMVSGFLTLTVKNDSGTSIATMTTNITPSMLFTGTWFHYAITVGYAGTGGATSKYTLYINGNYYNGVTAAYPIQGLYNTNYIGFNSSSNVYMTLLCDNFRVYAYPLTSGAVTALYSSRPTKKDSVNNKLVYYYKFIAKDISGNTGLKNYGVTNGYDGSTLSLSGAYSSVSKFNVVGRGSLRCGNGSYIIHRNFKAFTQDGMTCAFWIKIDANSIGSGNINPLGMFGGGYANAFLLELSINTTTGYLQTSPYMYVYQNGSTSFSSSAPTVPTGKTNNFTNWTHLCYVFYKNYTVLYINNVPYKIAFSWNGWDTYTGTSSFIGATNTSYFNGYMDDIRIYNTTLSQFEVTALYNYDGITEPNNNTLNITTKPVITSVIVTPNTSSSSLQLTWDGSFSTVNIYWNKTNSASVFDGSSVGLTSKTLLLTGLTESTIYYFTLVPVSVAGIKGDSFLTNFTTTTPVSISSFSLGTITGNSVDFMYGGNYTNIIVKYGTASGSTTYSKSIMGSSTTTGTVTDLSASTPYYFNIYPINNTNIEGTKYITELTGTTTAYTPTPFENLLTEKAPWGRYSAGSFSGTTLTDLTGNGRHATITGSYTSGTASGNGATASIPYLTGSTASIQVLWPVGSIPATNFTICEISRYIGSSAGTNGNNRIYGSSTSTAPDILIGHWNNVRGFVYWGNSKTNNSTKGTLTNWLSTCVKSGGTTPNNILYDGIASGTATITNSAARNLSINYLEPGSWSITHLIIWDQVLTDTEMALVSGAFDTYLSTGSMQ